MNNFICKSCCNDRVFKSSKPPVVRTNPRPVLSGFIKMRRLTLGMTRKELGAKIGVLADGIHEYECGKNAVRTTRLPALAEALGVSVQEIQSLAKIDAVLIKRRS